jgi:hypothetical protein
MTRRSWTAATLAFLLASPSAFAFTPESGFWWNPAEPGTGYNIEIQDNYLGVTAYVFRPEGPSQWFISAGPMVGNNGQTSNSFYSGTLDGFSGGQCIGCAYTGYPAVQAGAGGPISINFLTEMKATLTLGGRTIPIERQNFRLGDATDRMLGEWQLTLDFSEYGTDYYDFYPFVGDLFRVEGVDRSGTLAYFFGCRPASSTSTCGSNPYHAMDGEYIPSQDAYVADVIDVPEDQEGPVVLFTYFFEAGLNQFDGCVVVHDRNSVADPDEDDCYPVRGFRSASRSFVQNGVGPSSSDKSAAKNMSSISALLAKAGPKTRGGLTPDEAKARYGFDWRELLALRDAQRAQRAASMK